jgi:PKD repeat protein
MNPRVILGANQDFVAYQWDFGDGYTTTEKAPTHDYLKPGKFTISLKVEDNKGCLAQLTKKSYIASYSPPIINIELSDSLICENESIDFINKTQNTLDIRWSFQDKSFTDKNFTHFFTSADSLDLTVYVKDKNGCEETTTYKNKILILDAAEVKIDISEKAGCAPMNVHFTNETNEAVSYKWEIGDKIYNGKQFNVTFTEPGPIKVTAYTEQAEGCSSIRILDTAVMVYKSHIQAKASNYSGCLPLQSTFTLSSDNIHDVVWDFGDGEISTFTSPTKIYSKPGKYQVRVTFTNEYGCRESATVDRTINVYDTFVEYEVPDPMQICLFEEVTFSGSLGKGEWKWDFGDGNYSDEKEPQHHYTKAGTYTVRLEAINAFDCPIKIDHYLEITVVGVQSTEFDFTVNSCIDHLVELRSHGPDDFEYHWGINDSSMYSGQIVSHDFAKSGYYPIKLTTVDSFGCKMIQLKNELIYYDSCLSFTYYENEDSNKFVLNYAEIQVTNPNLVKVCSAPFEIDFQNPYHSASSWLWIFDDGSTSTEQNPTHEFKYPGTYDIDLIAYYTNGKIDSVLNFSKIIVGDQKVDFSFNSTALCDGFQVEFEDLSEMPVSWHWNFGDGDVSNLQHPHKVYKEEGQYLVNLITTDSWGCTKRAVQNVAVGNPYYYFDFPEYVCAGDSIVIEHNIGGFDSYSWDFGDGTIYNGINPHHFYSESGTYSVQLKAGTMENCERVFSNLHQIKSNKPMANFAIEGDTTGCGTLTVRFKNLSTDASNWKWDFGNGTISTERDPVIDFSAGVYTIQLTAYGGECSDVYTRSDVIEVHHIKADYSFTQSNHCFPYHHKF